MLTKCSRCNIMDFPKQLKDGKVYCSKCLVLYANIGLELSESRNKLYNEILALQSSETK